MRLLPVGLALTLTSVAPVHAADMFNRLATFPVVRNLPTDADASKPTVAEIISASEDGNILAYSNAEHGSVGLIDIQDPAQPKALGEVEIGGEPTSVKIQNGKVYAVTDTSPSKEAPSGTLFVIDIASKAIESRCELGGQPDSIAASADGRFLAVVIENERDEDKNDGALPQLPSGNLTVVPLKAAAADCAGKKIVDLTGIADIAPEDAEPEFVDINGKNQAVVTLQENNHLAVVDLAAGKVVKHFSAGTASLDQVDTKKDGVISLTGSIKDMPREPDAVKWIDDERFVIANEGDWKGGTRGFSIFNAGGTLEYDVGNALEHEVVRLGHYPDKRNKKGIEIEGAETGTFNGERLLFIGSERASVVAVYRDNGAGKAPDLLQILPGAIGPEGLLAIPNRNLFVTASEVDAREDGGAGSMVTIYRRSDAPADYPTLKSADDEDGLPIGWGALSGATPDASHPGHIFAVSDGFYSTARIFDVDTTESPALITAALTVTQNGEAAKKVDLEGIARRADGGFWLVSEGNPEKKGGATANLLLRTDANGAVQEEIALPESLASQATKFGFEGVTVTNEGTPQETVWIAVQREWKDDPKGMTKLLAYRPSDKSWGAVHYPLDKAESGWVGLSELSALPDGDLVAIERDNQIGEAARIKKLVRIAMKNVSPAPLGSPEIPVVTKTTMHDLLPDLRKPNGYVLDKVESLALGADGNAIVITDNDGVDGSSGETQLIHIGHTAID